MNRSLSRILKKAGIVAAIVIGIVVMLVAQQQSNGGTAVTITSGTVTLGAGAANIGAVAIQSGQTVGLATGSNAIGSITNTTFGISAGTAKIGITYPYTGCGTTAIESALAAMPTTTTSVTASTTCVLTLYLHNSSSTTAYTVTVTDAGGSNYILNGVSLQPLEVRQLNFPNGLKLTSGVKWSASNAAVIAGFEGLQ